MLDPKKTFIWPNLAFIVLLTLVALVGIPIYALTHGVSASALGLFAFFSVVGGFSITGGYHRLFAHAAYEAHPAVKAVLLFLGAGMWQNSALHWATEHRRHHTRSDTPDDPYSVVEGFWWAHVGWVVMTDGRQWPLDKYRDLHQDRLVRWQHRWFYALAVVSGFLLPAGIGALFGDALGGLLLGGFARIVVTHHATFCVNSVAHTLGSQPYSDRDTSRDSFVTAIITLGEGYHNFHHSFPSDYRNGVKAWQFDPTKWAIRALSYVGLARRLKRIPEARILKARLAMDAKRATEVAQKARPGLTERLEAAHARLEGIVDRWAELKQSLAELRRRGDAESHALRQRVQQELKETRRLLRETVRHWREMIRELESLTVTA